MSKVIRSVKNVTKGYSNVQIKVREGGSTFTESGCAVPRLDLAKGWLVLTSPDCSDQQ
jgi:hypothetical protein